MVEIYCAMSSLKIRHSEYIYFSVPTIWRTLFTNYINVKDSESTVGIMLSRGLANGFYIVMLSFIG